MSRQLLKIVFVGTRPLASRCLQFTLDNQELLRVKVVGVVGIPENTYGWWSGPNVEELWQIAKNNNIPFLSEADLPKIECDYLFCVFWGTIFKENVLSRPKYGCINLHTAPLPNYRGCHCYSHAILNEDLNYGSTMHFMDTGIDTGDLIKVIDFPILSDETAFSLYERTMEYSFSLFCEIFLRAVDGSMIREKQADFVVRTARTPRYYNNDSLLPYFDKQTAQDKLGSLNYNNLVKLKKSLHYPPKFTCPDWVDECLSQIKNVG